jgi:phosphatidylinositol 4-phosphatase
VDEVAEASSCKEAVDLIVETIRRACQDLGCDNCDFTTEEDVVRCAQFSSTLFY